MENKSQEDQEDLNAFKERCDELLIPIKEIINRLSNKETCGWVSTRDASGDYLYETSCGDVHYFSEGTIQSNNHKYCPYCGKPIEEVKDE